MIRPRSIVYLVAAAAAAGPVHAHPGRPLAPHDFWSAWSFEPGVLAGMALAGGAYLIGVRRLWRRAGTGRGVSRAAAACFAAGWLALFVALVSPVDRLGAALFSGHMLQHLLLMQVAAPLLVLGAPEVAWPWSAGAARRGVGRLWRRSGLHRAARFLTLPLVAWTAQAGALWAWHAPGPYDGALASEPVHALEHASFLVTAVLYWWTVAGPVVRHGRGRALALLSLFGAAMQSGVLGALLTFSNRPWYTAHLGATEPWGLTPLEDQQLAGVLMWAPASLPYLVAAGCLVVAALRAPTEVALRSLPSSSVSSM